MYYEKGLIVLTTFDLDLASKCPFSITLSEEIKACKDCVRCNAFSEIARYCFSRSFRGTNLPSEKRLKDKYDHILLGEGISEEERGTIIRKDSGILADILYLSKQHKQEIDMVEPEIILNFGRFSVRDKLDAILCIGGRYYITKVMCDDHPTDDRDLLRYETIVGSLWIRETYAKVNDNGVCFIQLSRVDPPIMRNADMTPSTEKLRLSVQSILDYLDPNSIIKNESDFNHYKNKELTALPIRFGNQCWTCQACFKF